MSRAALKGLLVVALVVVSPRLLASDPPVCSNEHLLKAIRIIEEACTSAVCDFEQLRKLDNEVDRAGFLTALSNPYLRPVHIFFPPNEFRLPQAFDWQSTKRDQMHTLLSIDNPDQAVVFIIGSASVTGRPGAPGNEHNRRLSFSRMEGVWRYLKDELKIQCREFRAGWLGREVLQLKKSDAAFLNISEQDYRDDELVLNQSVHVFVFPCSDKI